MDRAGGFYKPIRLGDYGTRPEFSNFSWFAMLFSTGIGIGILFFGVAEPSFCFLNTESLGGSKHPHGNLRGHGDMDMSRAVDAMRVTFFTAVSIAATVAAPDGAKVASDLRA